ncbi:MAG TPA: hypothetical protein VNW90_04005 [Acetobacteraceae bacterium]|nr:hypothetical protein [Acetobacteraceae bacterium]
MAIVGNMERDRSRRGRLQLQNAIGHYTSDDMRYMRRVQMMATKFSDRGILRELFVTVRVP